MTNGSQPGSRNTDGPGLAGDNEPQQRKAQSKPHCPNGMIYPGLDGKGEGEGGSQEVVPAGQRST
ncbi:short-chain dehydrogenase/reductase SDR [Anopheles sinensis]|uniref:Short-chain dehydrogenase/reductase SDR n=1 Tax=Anopheles sinensis TaxID=74873 RepID=A0A084WFT0_ANOSI|nr:short-chain dehydrogenase/reductase SDR [Anopheles sinensis]